MTPVDVAPERWVAAATAAREEGYRMLDVLAAADEEDLGVRVVLRLWSVQRREARWFATVVTDACPSLTGVFRAAAWHEREMHEMFGLDFPGHDDLRPLLLPGGFVGHPLRKSFPLAARAVKAWPGAKDPGESDASLAAAPAPGSPDGPKRARRGNVPPGVPEGWPAGLPAAPPARAGDRGQRPGLSDGDGGELPGSSAGDGGDLGQRSEAR